MEKKRNAPNTLIFAMQTTCSWTGGGDDDDAAAVAADVDFPFKQIASNVDYKM